MRVPLGLAALLLATLAPTAGAQTSGGHATLELDVQPDHAERMTLRLDGLRPLTEYHGICLPERARESRVHDEVGDVPYDVTEEDGRRVVSFTARSPKLTIDMRRPPPATDAAPLFAADVNFCVPSKTTVQVDVRVPPEHVLFFLNGGGTVAAGGRNGTTRSDGPAHVFYTYEAPISPGASLAVFDEGPFRVFAAPALADRAREVAQLASAPFDAALVEAGLTRPFASGPSNASIRVVFQSETPFGWESGHYNGQGYIAVKESTLDDEPETGYPYNPVRVLVHEAFHAASFPYGKGDVDDPLSWWLEGTARHAERQVDQALPNATIACERSAGQVLCWSFDDRIDRQNLTIGYDPAFTFQRGWEPSLEQTDDTRRFYYAYSEFVVAAWIAQHGEAPYRRVWDRVTAAFADADGCPCTDGWLVDILNDDAFFRPWAELRVSDPAGYEARIAPLVKDEDALQAALDEHSSPFGDLGIPAAGWGALAAVAVAAALSRRRG